MFYPELVMIPDPQRLANILQDYSAWADVTFPEATQHSRATHLAREARELANNPDNELEMADVLALLYHMAKHAGVDLAAALERKLAICKDRVWGPPDQDGVREHIR